MKLNIPRIFEKSKLLSTEVGQQLSDFLNFMSDFVEQVTRALRNQLTIADNMDAMVTDVIVPHETETIIYTNNKAPMGMHVLKVTPKDFAADSFRWYIDDQGRVIVWVSYAATPPTVEVTVKLAVYFN